MKILRLSLVTFMALGISSSVIAADNLESAFKEGQFNGKVRFNYFNWKWNDMDDYTKTTEPGLQVDAKGQAMNGDSAIAAVGGSLEFKTASLYGFSGQVGFFTSQPLAFLDKNAKYVKSGADLDLRDAFNTGYNYNAIQQSPNLALEPINVLAIANLQYQLAKTTLTVGRQYFDTPLTGTNDSKMIPNTFEGYTAISKDIPDTTLTVAYITRMKPRNQETFVGLLDNDSDVNKLLRTSGNTTTVNSKMIRPEYLGVLGAINKTIKGLELQAWYYSLDNIFNTAIGEVNYQIPLGTMSLTLGGRYLKQMDKLKGRLGSSIDVASFDGVGTGYTDKTSLNSSLYALRAILAVGAIKFQYGYSRVADKADIVSPWRGFPTFGYTRPMKIENWDANIKSWMVSAWYDFEKAGLIKGLDVNVNYLNDDRDETKAQPKGDMKTITADINYKFSKKWDGRIRYADHDDKGNTIQSTGTALKGWDFTEYRVEMNYRF